MLTLWEGFRINGSAKAEEWISLPGSYLIMIGFFLTCFALYEAVWGKISDCDDPGERERKNVKLLASIIILLAGYIMLISWIGFAFTSSLFLLIMMKIMGNPFRTSVIFVIGCGLGTYYLLPYLGISLPRGVLGF